MKFKCASKKAKTGGGGKVQGFLEENMWWIRSNSSYL